MCYFTELSVKGHYLDFLNDIVSLLNGKFN